MQVELIKVQVNERYMKIIKTRPKKVIAKEIEHAASVQVLTKTDVLFILTIIKSDKTQWRNQNENEA